MDKECLKNIDFYWSQSEYKLRHPGFSRSPWLNKRAQQHYGLPYAEALFDIHYFKENPRVFFDFSRELLGLEPQPSISHLYLAELENREKVELLVTQNIDMLHHKAGSKRVLECHGTYRRGRCMDCGRAFQLQVFRPAMERGDVPRCGEVIQNLREMGTAATISIFTEHVTSSSLSPKNGFCHGFRA